MGKNMVFGCFEIIWGTPNLWVLNGEGAKRFFFKKRHEHAGVYVCRTLIVKVFL